MYPKCHKWSRFVPQKWGICTSKCGILLYKCTSKLGEVKKVPHWGTSGGISWVLGSSHQFEPERENIRFEERKTDWERDSERDKDKDKDGRGTEWERDRAWPEKSGPEKGPYFRGILKKWSSVSPIFQGEHFTPRCEESGPAIGPYFRGTLKKWSVGSPIFQG